MSWPKPIITSEEKPQSPRLRRWLVFLLAVLFFTILLILLFKPAQPTTEEVISYLVVLIIELVVWALLFSGRMYNHGLALDRFDAWEQERQLVDLRWNEWAERHLTILASYVALPEGLTTTGFLTQSQDMSINAEQVLALTFYPQDDLGSRQQQAIAEILFALFNPLSALPTEKQILVEILQPGFSFDSLQKDFDAAWRQLELSHSTKVNVKTALSLKQLETWIDNPDDEIRLVIALGLENTDINQAFTASEFIGAFLIASESRANTLKLKPKARLLRPMLSTEKTLYDDLQQMRDIQRDLENAHHLWLSGFQGKQASLLVSRLTELKVDLRHEQEKSGVYHLDLYHGLAGKLNGWMALTLAMDAVNKTNEAQLAAAFDGQHSSLCLMLPARKREDV